MRCAHVALVAALLTSACEPAQIAAPPAPAAAPSASIQHGDGTPESPFYTVEAGEWGPTYSFVEGTALYDGGPAPCPPMYRGTLWLNINIANVGRRRFWFQGPFHWVTTIAPGYARYTVVVPGVDDRGEWTASGPVIAECRRGLLPGLGMIRLTDHEGQLRRNGINAGDGDGCGGAGGGDRFYMESYDPYSPVPDDAAGVTTSCGGGGGGDGFDPGNYSCTWDYITIEISRDGGSTWEAWWSGWAQVCEQYAS